MAETTSFIDECGQLNVPEHMALMADQRAFEIFEKEVHFGISFKKCLGMIYMVGVRAGIAAARGMKEETDAR